ncbi:hypothetical protein MPTK1_2g22360 [Marchantia polymorpha subsp. ruderalis]|uniref:GDSL esterase/lipase n=2 Tax=Marchantia polymorpha TaxID=3197 RepID=A0A176WTA8_MARPO|nr:hypothetical protein AXG93_3524s1180 [Marchantia polymorpha subsp. ruderalis]PTQ35354.1 hypothetical protein MARPO_0072s0091 [Marchantia polymorpha]|eukprot:PTQ35354.1 hypothetical protein MARPO_0072s0091 [Marchantia polymorpha]
MWITKDIGKQKMAFLLSTLFSFLIVATRSAAQVTPPLIVFGDSTVDTGNNNYINTTEDFLANFPPFGKDYFDKPTGRFSNGRVYVDFICEYAGRPHVSPYLEPGADHSKGVNFASGGSGVLDETNQGMAMSLKAQLQNFVNFEDGLIEKWGTDLAKKYFSDAIYLVSLANNDYMGGYFAKQELQQKYTPQEFLALVVSDVVKACEFLRSKGARKMVVAGVGPLGCIPAVRALHPAQECFEQGTQMAVAHNMALAMALKDWASHHQEMTVLIADFLTYMTERQDNPTAFGLSNGAGACCGNTAPCGRKDPTTGADYSLCSNAHEYVYWDAFHSTEIIAQGWSKEIWDGPNASRFISPMNLRTLFELSSAHDDEEVAELETYAGGSTKTIEKIDPTVL